MPKTLNSLDKLVNSQDRKFGFSKLRRTKVTVSIIIKVNSEHNIWSSVWISYHNSVDNVVVVVFQGPYSLGPRHVGLRHDKFDVLYLHAGLVNLNKRLTLAYRQHAKIQPPNHPQFSVDNISPPPLRSPPVLLASVCSPGCLKQPLPVPWTFLQRPAELAEKDPQSIAEEYGCQYCVLRQ